MERDGWGRGDRAVMDGAGRSMEQEQENSRFPLYYALKVL